ncbi:hypothetical protein BKA69DRAFT_1121817 [Paraphysoderma sedebokerense]|nr:hypothetical protein BKA69DRAFT_1121817 [Paraphysoderma sedebokerense]
MRTTPSTSPSKPSRFSFLPSIFSSSNDNSKTESKIQATQPYFAPPHPHLHLNPNDHKNYNHQSAVPSQSNPPFYCHPWAHPSHYPSYYPYLTYPPPNFQQTPTPSMTSPAASMNVHAPPTFYPAPPALRQSYTSRNRTELSSSGSSHSQSPPGSPEMRSPAVGQQQTQHQYILSKPNYLLSLTFVALAFLNPFLQYVRTHTQLRYPAPFQFFVCVTICFWFMTAVVLPGAAAGMAIGYLTGGKQKVVRDLREVMHTTKTEWVEDEFKLLAARAQSVPITQFISKLRSLPPLQASTIILQQLLFPVVWGTTIAKWSLNFAVFASKQPLNFIPFGSFFSSPSSSSSTSSTGHQDPNLISSRQPRFQPPSGKIN